MLLWIFVIVLIVAVLVCVICEINYFPNACSFISGTIAVLSAIVVAIMLICIAAEYINVDGRIESYKQEYESLSYQINNNLYTNDNDIGKKELYDQVIEWNKNLAYAKKAENDFWVGIFYADIYDEFDYICLPQK